MSSIRRSKPRHRRKRQYLSLLPYLLHHPSTHENRGSPCSTVELDPSWHSQPSSHSLYALALSRSWARHHRASRPPLPYESLRSRRSSLLSRNPLPPLGSSRDVRLATTRIDRPESWLQKEPLLFLYLVVWVYNSRWVSRILLGIVR